MDEQNKLSQPSILPSTSEFTPTSLLTQPPKKGNPITLSKILFIIGLAFALCFMIVLIQTIVTKDGWGLLFLTMYLIGGISCFTALWLFSKNNVVADIFGTALLIPVLITSNWLALYIIGLLYYPLTLLQMIFK